MSTDPLYKNGVEESNGDVTSGLPYRLVPETTFGRSQENHKTLKNSQTVADRRLKQTNIKKPPSVGPSNSHTISGEWRRLLPISVSAAFSQNEKALITGKRWKFDAKFLQNTNGKSVSANRMIKLLAPCVT
jgi:phenylalanyl-tRNA synthetase alpha subunit